MNKYETSLIIKSDDLNHHGTLFAGKAVAYLIEAGFIAVSMDYKNPNEIVCYLMDDFKFFSPVTSGSILSYTSQIVRLTNTGVTVYVKGECKLTGVVNMEGFITYIIIDSKTGKKKEHDLVLNKCQDEDEEILRQRANEIFAKKS